MTLEQALPLLVGPVAAGHSDMTLAQHTDYVSAALHNLVVSTRMHYTEPPHLCTCSGGLSDSSPTLSHSLPLVVATSLSSVCTRPCG